MPLKVGNPSKAIFNFPEEPRILKFLALDTTSDGKSFSSIILRNVRFGSRFETTMFAAISSPLLKATPTALFPLTIICSTSESTRISPPKDRNDEANASETAPMPPRAKPHAPTVPSTSPI